MSVNLCESVECDAISVGAARLIERVKEEIKVIMYIC